MIERRDTGVPEEPIIAEVGQSFKLFEGLVNLPFPRDHKTYIERVDYILSRDFEFQGIKATIALAVPDPDEVCFPDLPMPFVSPLGEPTVEYTYSNCREVPLKTPLQLITFATIASIDKFRVLSSHQFKIQLGDAVYYLDCAEKINDEGEVLDLINWGLEENWAGGHFVSRGNLYDAEGSLKGVVLPYDPVRLSTIEVTVVLNVFPASQNF